MLMEGRPWCRIAREHGAKLVSEMVPGKVYLYQLFTTCFVEFDTVEKAQAFREYADKNLPYWDYDPVAMIDTNDPHARKLWKEHMREKSREE